MGLISSRPKARRGVGCHYAQSADDSLLEVPGVDYEVGGELFYNFEHAPWMHLTLDAQVINSTLPDIDTAYLPAARLGIT